MIKIKSKHFRGRGSCRYAAASSSKEIIQQLEAGEMPDKFFSDKEVFSVNETVTTLFVGGGGYTVTILSEENL